MIRTLAATLLVLTLTACGGDDEPTKDASASPTESASTAELPACADIWVDGKTLPADYTGCTRDGETVEADAKPCGSGPETFVQYQYTDEQDITVPFIAIRGEKVIGYIDDENAPYAKTFDKCGGEPVG